MNHDLYHHESPPKTFWDSRYSVGLVVLGAIALYFLLTEHRAHLYSALPLLLLLACPLMHVFMHRGNGRHGGAHNSFIDRAIQRPVERPGDRAVDHPDSDACAEEMPTPVKQPSSAP